MPRAIAIGQRNDCSNWFGFSSANSWPSLWYILKRPSYSFAPLTTVSKSGNLAVDGPWIISPVVRLEWPNDASAIAPTISVCSQ